MHRFLIAASLLLLSLANPAYAQDSDEDSAGAVPQRGISDQTARLMASMLAGAEKRVLDNCWNLGCVLIVNQTSGYDVIGFYVDTAKPGEDAHWSRNQFAEPLRPSKATVRFKTGGPETCHLPIRFVLRSRETHEKAEINGATSLCNAPHQDTLVRIRMLEGKVYVRGEDEPPVGTH